MNNNIGYMVSPLGLTERQILIYQKLYEKCNFSGMTVKYTLEQIALDIKSIELTKKIVSNEIKSFIDKGYLKILKKGTKGNLNVFQIVKINEIIGNELATNWERIGNKKASKNKALDNIEGMNGERIGNKLVTPIKEKEKEYIYSDFIKKIISLYPGKKVKSVRDKKLQKLIDKYGEEQIVRCIKRYAQEVTNKDKQYILNESTFWNGRYVDYLDSNYECKGISKHSVVINQEDFIQA